MLAKITESELREIEKELAKRVKKAEDDFIQEQEDLKNSLEKE